MAAFFYSVSLSCLGACLGMVIALAERNPWALTHAWLQPWLIVTALVSALFAVLSSKWFRAIYQRLSVSGEPVGQKAIHQETHGSNSPTVAHSPGATTTVIGNLHLAETRPNLVPEVWVDYQASSSFGTGFVVQNRSLTTDACNVRFEPLQYEGFRLESEQVDVPRNSSHLLPAHETSPTGEHRRNATEDFLKRFTVEMPIVLKYESPFGDECTRLIKILNGSALFLNSGKKPKFEHGAIRCVTRPSNY